MGGVLVDTVSRSVLAVDGDPMTDTRPLAERVREIAENFDRSIRLLPKLHLRQRMRDARTLHEAADALERVNNDQH